MAESITKKEIAENTIVTRVNFYQYRYNYNNKEMRYDATNIEGRVYDGLGQSVGTFENGKKGFVDTVYADLKKY